MTGLGEGLYIFPVSFSFINTGIAVFFYKAPPDGWRCMRYSFVFYFSIFIFISFHFISL